MTTRSKSTSTWKFENLRSGFECEATLVAYWEVSLDPISDNFTPAEITAPELFSRWVRMVREKYPAALVPIWWFVDVKGENIRTFELMPFQLEHFRPAKGKNFLTVFTWPTSLDTGEPLNWLELPVVDKLWRPRRAEKGGFIQEATGWKPSIFQPYVYLPSLENAVPSGV